MSDNIRTVFISEWDKKAQETYYANFGDDLIIKGDITEIDESDIPANDILLAGFPCQAFSLAVLRKGFEDARGTLFFDVARITERHMPKVVFCENVKNLTTHDKGKTFKTIKRILNDLGYTVFHEILNSRDFGVAQNRERIYIVAFPDVYLESLGKHRRRHESKGNGFGYEVRANDDVAGALVCGGMGQEMNQIVDPRLTNFVPVTHIKGKINREYIRRLTPREWARLHGFRLSTMECRTRLLKVI